MAEQTEVYRRAKPTGWDSLRERWGWLLALGILWAVLGVLAIVMPFAATLALELVLGAIFAAGGLVQIIHAVRCWGARGAIAQVLGGLLALVLGGLLLLFPLEGIATLTLFLSAFFIVQGGFKLVAALQHRYVPRWGWILVSGILSIAVGVLIWLGWPASAIWALGLLVGIELIFSGCSMIMLALAARRG